MKNYKILIIFLIFVSCSKDDDLPVPDPEPRCDCVERITENRVIDGTVVLDIFISETPVICQEPTGKVLIEETTEFARFSEILCFISE